MLWIDIYLFLCYTLLLNQNRILSWHVLFASRINYYASKAAAMKVVLYIMQKFSFNYTKHSCGQTLLPPKETHTNVFDSVYLHITTPTGDRGVNSITTQTQFNIFIRSVNRTETLVSFVSKLNQF